MEANMKCMTLTVLCCLVIGRYAGALEKPPEDPLRQRSWLRRGLVNDMTEINNWMPSTFADQAFQRADAIAIPSEPITLSYKRVIWPFHINDDDVKLLADFYYHTRAQAEENLQQFQRQRAAAGQLPAAGQPPTEKQLPAEGQLPAANAPQVGPQEAELKAAHADGDAILDLGEKLAKRSGAVKSLTALIYASLPSFFLHQRQMTPLSYFHFDPDLGRWSYVGPVYEAYARRYADRYPSRHTASPDQNATAAAPPVQLPTWFPRQPESREWNRMTALRTMQAPRGMNTAPTGVGPGYGNTGSSGRGR